MLKVLGVVMLLPTAWAVAPLADASADPSQFMTLAERFGLWAALCVLLICVILWLSWKRELRMAARMDAMESERRQTALVLAENGDLLKQSLAIQAKQLEEQQRLNTELRCRPCLRDK